LELERSIEITDWLLKNPQVTHWVAVDDLNMSVEYLSQHFAAKDPEDDEKPGLTNFVHTPQSNEGIKQSGVKDKILKFLL
jgi:chorismate-pyruvate lyase